MYTKFDDKTFDEEDDDDGFFEYILRLEEYEQLLREVYQG